jgi:hypothetical protein
MGRRGRHHHTERAIVAQDPTPQCCCTQTGHRAACRHRVRSKLSRVQGPPTRHSVRLSLVHGDRQNRRTAPRFILVSRIAVIEAQRGAPPSGTESSCRPPHRSESSSCFPPRANRRHRVGDQRCRLRRLPTLYCTGEFQLC